MLRKPTSWRGPCEQCHKWEEELEGLKLADLERTEYLVFREKLPTIVAVDHVLGECKRCKEQCPYQGPNREKCAGETSFTIAALEKYRAILKAENEKKHHHQLESKIASETFTRNQQLLAHEQQKQELLKAQLKQQQQELEALKYHQQRQQYYSSNAGYVPGDLAARAANGYYPPMPPVNQVPLNAPPKTSGIPLPSRTKLEEQGFSPTGIKLIESGVGFLNSAGKALGIIKGGTILEKE